MKSQEKMINHTPFSEKSVLMKKEISILAFLASLFIVSAISCSRMEESPKMDSPSGSMELTVTASLGDIVETRTVRNADGSIWWTPGDAINLFYGTMDGGKFTTGITEAQETATFNGTIGAATGSSEAGMSAQTFWGVYPYDESNTCDGESVTLTIPGTQKGVPGTFANNLNPTVANSPGLGLTFYNVGSWFIFTVSQAGITSATFKGNNDENIAGKVRVTMDSNDKPVVAEVLGGVKSITITPQEGQSFIVGEEYRIVLLPQTLANGYTLTLRKGPQAVDFVSEGSKEFVRSSYRRKLNADSGLEWSGDFVEMGEGIYWAKKNIGASNPEDNGYYFAWGETETKASYNSDWSNYKYGSASNKLTKYNIKEEWGEVDPFPYMHLLPEDDAARVNLGPGWSMPWKEDWQWLIDNCSWVWTTDYEETGKSGFIVTSNVAGYASSSIFLPAAGFYGGNQVFTAGSRGHYWSSSYRNEDPYYPSEAYELWFDKNGETINTGPRYTGCSVRAIYKEVAVDSVFLSSHNLQLGFRETATLTAVVSPTNATDNTVMWSSSDPSVASVSQDGLVTAVGLGTATITVTTVDGGFTATCSVTVSGISVESVSLDESTLLISKDRSRQLTATVLPTNASNPAVEWSSSDETVATVSFEGLVTGIKAGSATITVTTIDGGLIATCDVTVEMAINGFAFVEMGVTTEDGTVLKWATMNVGADKPQDYGDFFGWGETEPYYSSQSPLTWKDGKSAGYAWGSYSLMYPGMSSYTGISKYQVADGQTSAMWYYDGQFIGDGLTELERVDDAAQSNWGGTWRMPTDAEWTKLRDTNKFTWSWTSDYNGTGVSGETVTSKVPGYIGNQIFLPAAGSRYGTSLSSAGSYGYYWSSSLCTGRSNSAFSVYFYSGDVLRSNYYRYYGFSVRPVSE